MIDVETLLADAVRHFWRSRAAQKLNQGTKTGRKDAGNRGAVTAGKHADGFVRLVTEIVHNAGLQSAQIHVQKREMRTLPGYFRPSKEWDIVVTQDVHLVAAIEIKTQVGSFGNNYNNRVEEAVGSASDLWAAYKAGLLMGTQEPWVGYIFMIEDAPKSSQVTQRITLSPYQVDEEFQTRSYVRRYELTCLRLVRERLYNAACLLASDKTGGLAGHYREPNAELAIASFARQLHARAAAFAAIK
jgi:hypothetical protein